jgi:hypothetical protein
MNNKISGRWHLPRISVLTLALLGSAILGKADIPPGSMGPPPVNPFTIIWTAWESLSNPTVTFTLTTESPLDLGLDGFSNNTCFVGCIFGLNQLADPAMEIDAGGDADPLPGVEGTITIPPDRRTFFNPQSFDIMTLDFTTRFVSSYDHEIFSCSGNEFTGCGFRLDTTDPNNPILDIRFDGPMAVPEPASWMLLLTVAGAVALRRARLLSKRG